MIINPNLRLFRHTSYVLLYDKIKNITYRIGITEFNILLCYCNKRFPKDDTVYKSDSVKKFLENCKLNHILVEYDYQEVQKSSVVKTLVKFDIDKTHKRRRNLFALLVLYLCIPALTCAITYMYASVPKLSKFIELIKYNKVVTSALLFSATLISLTIHEVWHMLIAHHEGADVPLAGLKLFGIILWPFIRIIGIDSLAKRSRIRIFSAGIASNLFFGSISIFVSLLPNPVMEFSYGLFLFGVSNIAIAVTNLLFLFKLDGNFILCNLFEEKKLDILSSYQAILHAPRGDYLYSLTHMFIVISFVSVLVSLLVEMICAILLL